MLGQRTAGNGAGAVDHVEHTIGQPRLHRQFSEQQCRQWRLLRRLEDDGAADRQSRCQLPGSHREREVPRHDRTGHAHGLALDLRP